MTAPCVATAAMGIVFGCGHVVNLANGDQMPHACPQCVLETPWVINHPKGLSKGRIVYDVSETAKDK